MSETAAERNQRQDKNRINGKFGPEYENEAALTRPLSTVAEEQQSAPQVDLAFGPSIIKRGVGIAFGYSVGISHMSREFIAVEDREVASYQLADRGEPGTRNSVPAYWMRQFEAYDIFEEEAPADFSDDQKAGFDSVSLKGMNLDLDHQSFHTNAFSVSKNEKLALNKDAVYRRHAYPERQARLDAFWGARGARLTSVREQLEALEAAEKTDRTRE
jgi:hypothetical protein